MDFHIRQLEEKDLAIVEKVFSNMRPGIHKKRFEDQQRGNLMYLTAWDYQTLIGRIMIKWYGANDTKTPSIEQCPHLESLFVIAGYRGRGVGTKLMLYCEELAREKGFSKIGLSVGDQNTTAHSLYTKLGYKNAGFTPYVIGDNFIDTGGAHQQWQETCRYFIKDI